MSLTIDLAGKTALVTGASSGIGAEIAFTLALAGAAVGIVGRDHARLESTSRRIEQIGGRVVSIAADLTAPGAPAKIVEEAAQALGGLTTLVHSAGIFEVVDMDQGADPLDRALAINVRAPYAITSAALPHLRGNGTVIFVSSIGGHVGFPGCTAYGTSKGAIEGLVKSLAVEEAERGVRVAAVAPGNVRTPLNAHLFEDPDYLAGELALTPMRRIGEVTDIAPAVAFLASNSASYITGISLIIDGGVVAS